jgi:hypothetical protein
MRATARSTRGAGAAFGITSIGGAAPIAMRSGASSAPVRRPAITTVAPGAPLATRGGHT